MSDNIENRRDTRRISSILKNVAISGDSPTQTFSRRSKRISFSHVNNVKEFVADGDNQTIWCESYEKSQKVKDGRNSTSSLPIIDSISAAATTTTSDFSTQPSGIDLFADIESVEDDDVEMEMSNDGSQTPTRCFNQTMIIDESTSFTRCEMENGSLVTYKRKTIETISVDKAIGETTKSTKIRRMNDENLEPHAQNTILQHADMSISMSEQEAAAISQWNSPNLPKTFDKTSVAVVDITTDDQSITSSISGTSKPIDKTQIFGRGDISAGIDQTFAVHNPLQENNTTGWNPIEKQSIDGDESHEHETENNVPIFQHDISRQRMIDDLTISMDFRFRSKDRNVLSPSLNDDEPVIEDLTIMLDTNFKAEVSGENDLISANDSVRNDELVTVDPSKDKENVYENTEAAQNSTKKLSEDTIVVETVDAPDRQGILSPSPDNQVKVPSDNQPKNVLFDCTVSNDPAPPTEFSFGHSEPLSSTRFDPKFQLNFSNSETTTKANTSSVTFNYCPTTRHSRDLRSGVSMLQNNTDELCNLEPDQLKKRSEMKKLFLNLSANVSNDMLSETKMDLVDSSHTHDSNESKLNYPSATELMKQSFLSSVPATSGTSFDQIQNLSARTEVINEDHVDPTDQPRCRKCVNCRKSLDGNKSTFLRKDQLSRPVLDFGLDEFKGLASLKDVVRARKEREAAEKHESESVVDQNIDAPNVRFLWLNKRESEKIGEPKPVYVPEPLICLPMRMTIEYLMRNKMRTEYPQWTYNDNFFYIGAIALRNEKIPSIRIHIKFEADGPAKAEKLNMPLLFNRVFIEECSIMLKRPSPANFLKHKHCLASLPMNLRTILSGSDNIYRGLDEIGKSFDAIAAQVNEIDALTATHDAFFTFIEGKCVIEKTVFNIRKCLKQEIVIRLDNINTVGHRDVYFTPFCETTKEFDALPMGLPFLRTFLADPKSYLLSFQDG